MKDQRVADLFVPECHLTHLGVLAGGLNRLKRDFENRICLSLSNGTA
jgi:hypothetical protein